MLLERKRINFWAKWIAIVLAAAFALSSIILGVGSAGGNIFTGCSGTATTDSSFDEEERFYLQQLEVDPADTEAMMALAALYSAENIDRFEDATNYISMALETDPDNVTLRLQAANIYLSAIADGDAAYLVLLRASEIEPENAQVFLKLGQAAKMAGLRDEAIAAWKRFLELAPESDYADDLRAEITRLEAEPTITGADGQDLDLVAKAEQVCPDYLKEDCVSEYVERSQREERSALCVTEAGAWTYETPYPDSSIWDTCIETPNGRFVDIIGG